MPAELTQLTVVQASVKFTTLRHRYVAFAQRNKDLIAAALDRATIPYSSIDCRAKTVESFERKALQKGYGDPVAEVTDLAGVRVVTYHSDDIGRVKDLIRSEFSVDDSRSVDKQEQLDDNEFGYQSVHLISRLAQAHLKDPALAEFDGMTVEIQLRSVCQHAWASLSHRLAYKRREEVPREFRRRLSRLSALLELADQEFAMIRNGASAAGSDYASQMRRDELGMALNKDSLLEYLKRIDVAGWHAAALSGGMGSMGRAYEQDLTEAGSVSRLLQVLQWSNAKTISDAAKLLSKAKSIRARVIPQVVDKLDEPKWFQAVVPDVMAVCVIAMRVHDPEEMARYMQPSDRWFSHNILWSIARNVDNWKREYKK